MIQYNWSSPKKSPILQTTELDLFIWFIFLVDPTHNSLFLLFVFLFMIVIIVEIIGGNELSNEFFYLIIG